MEEASDTFLRGPRILLCPMEREDLPGYRELFSDPEVNLSYGGVGIPDSLSKLQRCHAAGEFDITDRNLHLVIQAEGGMVGQVTLRNEENLPSRATNFGILIGAGYRGRGYGTEETGQGGR